MNKYSRLENASLVSVIKSLSPKKVVNRFIIFGYFGMRNIGDDLILHQELTEIKEYNLKAKVVVPSEYPSTLIDMYKVQSFKIKHLVKFFEEIRKCEVVIFGGGGLICNTGIKGSLKLFIIDIVFDLYKGLFLFILPKLFGKKIIVFGIGAYDNINIYKKIIYKYVLRFSDYISVRDTHSYNFLRRILPNKQIHLQKDVAFSLKINKILPNDLTLIKRSSHKKNIGISLISLNNPETEKNVNHCLIEIMNKYKVYFNYYYFPFNNELNSKNDLTVGKFLANHLDSDVQFEIIPYDYGPAGFMQQFKKLDFAICTRFHAQVLAYINGVNFIGLSYDKKCESFLKDINNKYININNLKLTDLDTLLKSAI